MLQRSRLAITLLALLLVLAGCSNGDGGKDESEPTETPIPTAIPTYAAGQVPVSQLVDGIATMWPNVTNARVSYYTGVSNNDITTATEVRVEEMTSNGDRRIVVLSGGNAVDEQIFVGGRVFMRGTFVTSFVAPNMPPGTWVNVDPRLIPEFSPVGQQLSALTAPFGPPLQGGSFAGSMRVLPATNQGSVDVEGKPCTLWQFSEQSSSGVPINYQLAVDGQGLPCQFVVEASGTYNVTVFELNVPDLAIIAPDAATPVSGTPEG